MNESYENRCVDNSDCCPKPSKGPDAERRREIYYLAEMIVAQVKAAKVEGRERCFLNSLVHKILDSE